VVQVAPRPRAAEIPSEGSFCAYAIRGEELFVVPDATRDERFAGNPIVVGAPDIRFYAGAPLAAPDGRKIGTPVLARPPAARADSAAADRPARPRRHGPGRGRRTAGRRSRFLMRSPVDGAGTRAKILAGFGAALAALVVTAMLSYRAAAAEGGASRLW